MASAASETSPASVARTVPDSWAYQDIARLQPGENFEPVRHFGTRQIAPALHRHIDDGAALLHARVIDAEPGDDVGGRHHDRAARTRGDPNEDALADEIIAEPGDLRVGNHPAFLDLRINKRNHSKRGSVRT